MAENVSDLSKKHSSLRSCSWRVFVTTAVSMSGFMQWLGYVARRPSLWAGRIGWH